MRCSIAFFVLLACNYTSASAQTYGLDNTDPSVFSKFKIPDTKLNSLRFGTDLSFISNNSYGSSPGYSTSSSSTNLNYSLAPRYYLLEENDDRYLSLSTSISGAYQYQGYQSQASALPTPSKLRQNYGALALNLTNTYRDYFTPVDVYYSVNSSIVVDMEGKYRYQSNSNFSREYSGQKTQDYAFGIGIGWGKIRNVTSVVSAIRLQERLKQLNLLNHDLSEKIIEDLAGQFYRQGYYTSIHSRPDKFFWQDVERSLSNDGVSLDGLNQYADSYIREVPNELRFSRNEGLIAGINLRFNYNNAYYSDNPSNGLPAVSEQFYTLVNGYVTYSHQLNLNSQINFNVSLSGGPNVIRNSAVRQEYVAAAALGYSYELTDRLVTSINNAFNLQLQNESGQYKEIQNYLDVVMNYFVEDDLSLSASYSWDYNYHRYQSSQRRASSDRTTELSL